MARRPAAGDALLALALGPDLQVELIFIDAPRDDLLVARVALGGSRRANDTMRRR
jgi:hypothetical protein